MPATLDSYLCCPTCTHLGILELEHSRPLLRFFPHVMILQNMDCSGLWALDTWVHTDRSCLLASLCARSLYCRHAGALLPLFYSRRRRGKVSLCRWTCIVKTWFCIWAIGGLSSFPLASTNTNQSLPAYAQNMKPNVIHYILLFNSVFHPNLY